MSATDDIYTFPNYFSYDGSSNGYETGIHLLVNDPGTLVLSFTGGDQLHSNVYSQQVSLIQYKTGSNGTFVTCTEANVLINSSTGYETITLSNIIPTSIADVHIHVTLKGPDGTVMSSPLIAIIPNTAISSSAISISDASILCRGWNFHETFASDLSLIHI